MRMAVVSRYLTITQGNLDHRHVYLTECMDIFPADVLGGSNKGEAAPRTVRLQYGSESVDTDIVRDKNMFRRRDWVPAFFAACGVVAGGRVLLEQLDPYSYRISGVPEQEAEPGAAVDGGGIRGS
jgi:hypothetical protein